MHQLIRNHRAILVLSLLGTLSIVTTGQTPTPEPCSQDKLRTSMVEARLAGERARAETSATLADSLRKELDQRKSSLINIDQQLQEEKQTTVSLQEQITELKIRLEQADQVITTVVTQRDIAEAKIQRENKRWNCRILHLGCIGER